ncbi:hypothetical protein, partial [Pseudomonas sp. NFACC52]|uniref:hypothetical protein n=1 Tax=Pseudomonas sp. NFACC52 TaxID=1566219 RepID=UPI001C46EC98
GRWFESNRAYQTKSALLGGLEGLTERWALFCWCLEKLWKNDHRYQPFDHNGSIKVWAHGRPW